MIYVYSEQEFKAKAKFFDYSVKYDQNVMKLNSNLQFNI